MKLVLLSGGSGKRLWPLSNDSRSKQFLKVLDDKGNLESMVQRVWRQLEGLNLSQDTIITTSKSQVDMLQNQLGNQVPIITEPERRDTFPAIALAATYLYSIQGTKLSEVVGVLPVDPYVGINFFQRIKDLENTLNISNAEIALMGVTPTYPSEKYGYIVPAESLDQSYIEVSHFKEKPSEMEAKLLIERNALWNCGVFAFKLEYIISILLEKGLPIQYEELLKQYYRLEKTSFDYAVVEKANKIAAISYDGSWKDLGTWNTLTEEMSTNRIGKGIISQDSTNTHLVNELDIQVAIIGIKNAVVAVSPDGILISDKSESPKVKELLQGFEQRPMYEERKWGWYRVLDHTKFNDQKEVLTKRICIKTDCNLSYQLHNFRNEMWTIINGEGLFAFNGNMREVKTGEVIVIPAGMHHAIKAISDLEMIEVQSGSQLIDEDIKRLYNSWEEIEENCTYLKSI